MFEFTKPQKKLRFIQMISGQALELKFGAKKFSLLSEFGNTRIYCCQHNGKGLTLKVNGAETDCEIKGKLIVKPSIESEVTEYAEQKNSHLEVFFYLATVMLCQMDQKYVKKFQDHF